MSEEPTSLAEQTFRILLTAAITRGDRPPPTTILGPTCWIALDALAREHLIRHSRTRGRRVRRRDEHQATDLTEIDVEAEVDPTTTRPNMLPSTRWWRN